MQFLIEDMGLTAGSVLFLKHGRSQQPRYYFAIVHSVVVGLGMTVYVAAEEAHGTTTVIECTFASADKYTTEVFGDGFVYIFSGVDVLKSMLVNNEISPKYCKAFAEIAQAYTLEEVRG